MELATLHLKLGGDPKNTVFKYNITPAQLALYAFMHGEDCVQSLKITGTDKARTIGQEMERLRAEFSTDHAAKCLNQLFPGIAPHLPVTFQSIGYDPGVLVEDESAAVSAANRPPVPRSDAEAKLRDKIASAAQERATTTPAHQAPPVAPQELSGALDDTGGDDGDEGLELSDDPLDLEMQRNLDEEEGTPPLPPAA